MCRFAGWSTHAALPPINKSHSPSSAPLSPLAPPPDQCVHSGATTMSPPNTHTHSPTLSLSLSHAAGQPRSGSARCDVDEGQEDILDRKPCTTCCPVWDSVHWIRSAPFAAWRVAMDGGEFRTNPMQFQYVVTASERVAKGARALGMGMWAQETTTMMSRRKKRRPQSAAQPHPPPSLLPSLALPRYTPLLAASVARRARKVSLKQPRRATYGEPYA